MPEHTAATKAAMSSSVLRPGAERCIEVVLAAGLGRRRELRRRARHHFIDVLNGAARHRRHLLPERQRVPTLLFVRLVADEIDFAELHDRLGGSQEQHRHTVAQAVAEPLGDFHQAPLDGERHLIVDWRKYFRGDGHQRFC
jgi:hypothetical protein